MIAISLAAIFWPIFQSRIPVSTFCVLLCLNIANIALGAIYLKYGAIDVGIYLPLRVLCILLCYDANAIAKMVSFFSIAMLLIHRWSRIIDSLTSKNAPENLVLIILVMIYDLLLDYYLRFHFKKYIRFHDISKSTLAILWVLVFIQPFRIFRSYPFYHVMRCLAQVTLFYGFQLYHYVVYRKLSGFYGAMWVTFLLAFLVAKSVTSSSSTNLILSDLLQ